MNDLFSREGIASVIADVIQRAEETAEENDGSDFDSGKMQAYYEILDMLKSRIIVRDGNPDDFGLGFELENLLKRRTKTNGKYKGS